MNKESQFTIEEQGIDLRKWLVFFLGNWYLFLGSLIIALITAFIFIAFSISRYELSVQILVRNIKNPLDKEQIFAGALYDPYQLENEKSVLLSKSVTRNALRQLDFYTGYFDKYKLRKKELYNQTPFIVIKDTAHLQPLGVFFTVNFLNDTLMMIRSEGEDVLLYDYSGEKIVKIISEFKFTDTIRFGQITGNSYCRFSFMPGFEYLSTANRNKTYYFRFFSLDELAGKYRRFKIDNSRGSSILTVKYSNDNPYKAADFLNSLINVYLRKGTERDNNIAEATIRFIDAQLIDVVDSLHQSGERLQLFKSSNKVLDIGYQAEKAYNKIESIEADKAKLLVKRRYFNYLLESLNSKSDASDLIAPSSLEINDPVLNKLITELAGMYSDRAELSFNSVQDNPLITSLELKIKDTRQKLAETAYAILDAANIALEDIEQQLVIAEQALNRLPKEQQRFINFERKFKLNDELYTYLLTRRSEMEIFKASNLPASEMLDKASPGDAVLVSPNKRISFIVAILFGLLFPGILLYLRESINNKIRTRSDIQRITPLPIVGQIVESKATVIPALMSEPNSILSESYRTLRTNLKFIIDEATSNVILITSARQGEGKSFTALNLAAIYSSYGKKTVLVDFDLRKSSIKEVLGLKPENGLSNYLSKNASYEEIILRDKKINFDLVIAGPVPPNPSELVASEYTVQLFQRLRKDYNMIVVDSPPIGIVSDAINIYPHADIALLVVRYNFTSVEIFENAIEDLKTKSINKVNIVLNDLTVGRGRYGYGYGYEYSYSYTNHSKKKKWNGIAFWKKNS